MARRRKLDRVVLAVLVAGALLFVLLLSGVGSGLVTNSVNYTPPSGSGPSGASPP
jgi:hypothetical protein